jgi:hypothetical protein
MTRLMDQILSLARLTLREPRGAARRLFAEDVPIPARTAGLLLIAVLSAIFLHLSFALESSDDYVAQFMTQSPLQTAVVQWFVLLISALLIYRVGKAFGGIGSLADAILVVLWLQFLLLGVQFAQFVLLIVVPPLAAMVGLVGFVLFLWLMVNFIAELHGFRSLGAVFAGMILTFFAVALLLALLLGLILGPEALQGV